MAEIGGGLLILIGVFFLLTGSLGLLRLPDVLCRMHATTKSTTLGACSVLLAVVVLSGYSPMALKAILAILFLLLTAPAGAHMIARAAYRGRVPLAEHRMVANALKGVVEAETYLVDRKPAAHLKEE